MVDTLRNLVNPFLNVWNNLTTDPVLTELKRFPSGTSLGNDYVSKSMYAAEKNFSLETERLTAKLYQKSSLVHFLEDNWAALTFLAGLDRVLSFRQSLGVAKARFIVGDSNMGALQALSQKGLRQGYFKGYAAFLFQQVGIRFHASQLSGECWLKYLAYSSLLELAFYPLDTVKTIMQADVSGKHYPSYREVIRQLPAAQLMRGVQYKLFFNACFVFNLKAAYDDSFLGYLSLPVWLLGYGMLNFKSKAQIADTALSFQSAHNERHFLFALRNNVPMHHHFAGFLPFLALNTFFVTTLPILYSADKKQALLQDRASLFDHHFRNHQAADEKKWA